MTTEIRQRALALYKPPFRYEHGYVFDSTTQMVVDDPTEGGAAGRVRGWGRIQKMPDAHNLQDEFGQVLVDALDMYYASKVPPDDKGEGPDYEDGPDSEGFSGPRPFNSYADEHEALTFHELPPEPKPLRVVITSFPESNGRRNWTAMFKRVEKFGGLVGTVGGITIARGEYWNRVAYEAERARVLLGLRESEPWILEYGDDVETPEEWTGYDKDAGHGVNMDKPKPERGE